MTRLSLFNLIIQIRPYGTNHLFYQTKANSQLTKQISVLLIESLV